MSFGAQNLSCANIELHTGLPTRKEPLNLAIEHFQKTKRNIYCGPSPISIEANLACSLVVVPAED
eukprot:scaffold417_cov97-Cylindrotheca_fusiformis.AAC.5